MEVWEGTSSVARLLSASSVHMPDLAAPVVRGCCDLARILLASRWHLTCIQERSRYISLHLGASRGISCPHQVSDDLDLDIG